MTHACNTSPQKKNSRDSLFPCLLSSHLLHLSTWFLLYQMQQQRARWTGFRIPLRVYRLLMHHLASLRPFSFIRCAWILFYFNSLGLRSRKAEEIGWNPFSVSLHTEPASTRFVFEMCCRGPDGFPLDTSAAFCGFLWHFVSRMFTRGGEILFPGPKEFWMLIFSPSNTYKCILWLFKTIVLNTDLETVR